MESSRKDRTEYTFGICVLIFSLICSVWKAVEHAESIEWDIKTIAIFVYTIPLYAFMLILMAILPSCALSVIEPFRKLPEVVQSIIILSISSFGIIALID